MAHKVFSSGEYRDVRFAVVTTQTFRYNVMTFCITIQLSGDRVADYGVVPHCVFVICKHIVSLIDVCIYDWSTKIRIISKFRDFYDNALALGHDEHTVYVRQTSEYPLKAHWSPKGWIQPDVPAIVKDIIERIKRVTADDIDSGDWDWRRSRSVIMGHFSDKEHEYRVSRFSVLFCGKHYPGLRVSTSKKTPGIPSTVERYDWFYSADDTVAFMAGKGVDAEKEMVNRNKSAADGLRDYFTDRQLDVDWLIEHKVTAVVYEIYGDRVLINPPLKDYGFFKAIDHYTAFQELDMWISGTLAWPQNMMIELDDKYRVMAHGFDMKYGFRTRPKNER